MTLEQLRLKHPRLVYKKYEITKNDSDFVISYEFLLEPDIVFRPMVSIPFSESIDTKFLEPYAFNLGMVEAISYWKAACPKELIVEAGFLDREHIRFWYDLFIHGLGEFFYRNQIDFTKEDFLKITSRGDRIDKGVVGEEKSGDLVLVGGGKDSAVTLGILKESDRTIQTMMLNPTKAAIENNAIAGFSNPIIVQRTIDPALFTLNSSGYLNGHTPFSAYLAFLGVFVAAIYGHEHVIVSNEQSANEGNVMYKGMEINHQYSKSYRFEQQFRELHQNYFSILRPVNNLQIGKLFSHYPQFFRSFRSCNVGSKTNTWCGACAKCAFTYLTLFPFVPYCDMMAIFGFDYFTNETIMGFIRELVGLIPVKPFECVGTRDEAKLAVHLSVLQYKKENKEIPMELLKIKSDMGEVNETIMDTWADVYNLPSEYQTILRSVYERM